MCGIALVLLASHVNGHVSAAQDGIDFGAVEPLDPSAHLPLDILASLAIALSHRGPDALAVRRIDCRVTFLASLLSLRGPPTPSPVSDAAGNVLSWNGEIWGGIGMDLRHDDNDAAALLAALSQQPDPEGVGRLLSRLDGPFALLYYQKITQRIFFARDPLGRRSLLMRYLPDRGVLLLSSVAIATSHDPARVTLSSAPVLCADMAAASAQWVEVRPGAGSIYCLQRSAGPAEWALTLTRWPEPLSSPHASWLSTGPPCGARVASPSVEQAAAHAAGGFRSVAARLLDALSEAIGKHVASRTPGRDTPVALLFSGGLDSAVLAALAHRYVPPDAVIELVNVSFGTTSFRSSDRKAALAALEELQRLFPSRTWRLIAADVTAAEVATHAQDIARLLVPCVSSMDWNIGAALWFAARAATDARVLLLGTGADEVLGGYAHHRHAFAARGWVGLHEAVLADLRQIWWKNTGRDDRVLSDSGREARHPFLDEGFLALVLALPLWQIVDYSLGRGAGEKKLLREAATLLGFSSAVSARKKAAIHHGSKAAIHTNAVAGFSGRGEPAEDDA